MNDFIIKEILFIKNYKTKHTIISYTNIQYCYIITNLNICRSSFYKFIHIKNPKTQHKNTDNKINSKFKEFFLQWPDFEFCDSPSIPIMCSYLYFRITNIPFIRSQIYVFKFFLPILQFFASSTRSITIVRKLRWQIVSH